MPICVEQGEGVASPSHSCHLEASIGELVRQQLDRQSASGEELFPYKDGQASIAIRSRIVGPKCTVTVGVRILLQPQFKVLLCSSTGFANPGFLQTNDM
jgi:hypothetical protein